MAWTNIPNANLAAGAPIRSVDLIALRDNITAQANGESGAPKTQNAAIASGIVNSLNGQQGSIVDTALNSIGSIVRAAYYGTSPVYAGQTVSGSILYVPNAVNTANTTFVEFYTNWSDVNVFTLYSVSATQRRTGGNTGALPPAGSATLSGTWRCMDYAGQRNTYYNACENLTFNNCGLALFVRVS